MNAKASKTRNVCSDCKIRPVGGGVGSGYEDEEYCRQQRLCLPCGDEGQMSNSHHNGHEAIPEAECWYCHPELNEATKPYVERTGTSRQGMTMVVSLRADAATKATQVKSQLPAGFRAKMEADGADGVKMTGSKGAKDAKISFWANWDYRGRWTAGTVNGRKVRNAKELLRVLAALSA